MDDICATDEPEEPEQRHDIRKRGERR
jgi:hypothetical protein